MSKRGYLLILVFGFLLFGYLYLVTSFFNGLQNAKLFDDIPDLIVALTSFALIMPALDLKDSKSRILIIIGASSLIINRLVQVFIQEYQAANGIWAPFYYWSIADFFMFLGIILVLSGFERVKSDKF